MISLGISLWPRNVGGGASLARPSAPEFTVAPDETDGEATITLTANPSSWGDATVPDDAAGAAGILEWYNPVDGWQELADPVPDGGDLPLEYEITLPEALWGTTTTIRVRGVNATDVNGSAAAQSLAVPDGVPEEAPSFNSTPVLDSTGRVTSSATVTVDASGTPEPAVFIQHQYWDGAAWQDISGATQAEYAEISYLYFDTQISALVTLENGIGSPVQERSNSITVIRAVPTATNSLGPFTEIVGVPIDPIDVTGAFTDPGFPDNSAFTFSLGTAPAWMDLTDGIITGTPDGTYSGPVSVNGETTGGIVDTTFSLTVSEAPFAPLIVTPPSVGGSQKIGGTRTGGAAVWSAYPAITGIDHHWQKRPTGGGSEEDISGATSIDLALTEDLDLHDVRRGETADNGVGDPVTAWTDWVPVTYEAPVASEGTAIWTVEIGDGPEYTISADQWFTVAADLDLSGVSYRALIGVPEGGGEDPFVPGIYNDDVFEDGGGMTVDITIDGTGLITMDHDALLADLTIYVQYGNSGGYSASKALTINIAASTAAPEFVSPFFPPPAPTTGYVMPYYEVPA